MKITKLVFAAMLLIFGCGVASAQQSKSDEALEFKPYWSVGLQGGVAATVGEAAFGKLISPAGALNLQWQFHHALGVRLGIGGWQGKGAYVPANDVYAYQYAGANLDLMLDLTSLIGGFRHDRICSAYVLGGVGVSYGFNNTSAAQYKRDLRYYWKSRFFAPCRLGLGADFRLSDIVSLGIEADANAYSDKFNSKKANNADWHFGLLAGVKFNLGKNTREYKGSDEAVVADQAAIAAAVAAATVAVAEAEKHAAQSEAAKLDAEKNAEKVKAELLKANEARIAAERALVSAKYSQEIFFLIGSSEISKIEDNKLASLASWIKDNPDYSVVLVGYSDKETGTVDGNLALSEKRAKAVAQRLVELGIPMERITLDHKGDTEQPFSHNDKNRVVICTLK